MNLFGNLKSQKWKKLLNILKNGFKKQILNFHCPSNCPSKLYATHQNYEILLKSLVPIPHSPLVRIYSKIVKNFAQKISTE
jgi:hypothetical protein